MRVAHRLLQSPAGADPAAVGALAPPPDDQRNEDERLQERDHQPQDQRLVGEHVPGEKRPGEDEAHGAPVLTPLCVPDGLRKELIRDPPARPGVEQAVVPRPRQEDEGQQEQRHDLDHHQRQGLDRDVGDRNDGINHRRAKFSQGPQDSLSLLN